MLAQTVEPSSRGAVLTDKADFYVGYFRNMSVLLLLVGVMAFILVKLKNRQGGGKLSLPGLSFLTAPMSQAAGDSRIEVLERKVIEARKTLYLVKVFDDQYWLIGTTDTTIEALGQVNPPGYLQSSADAKQTASGESKKPFSDYLDKA